MFLQLSAAASNSPPDNNLVTGQKYVSTLFSIEFADCVLFPSCEAALH